MLNRRAFLSTLAAPALIRAAPRPNIVMIYADDMGYGDLGCYGHPTIHTPNLDRMADEGMRFTQWYSAAPVCTPSRAALLTGRYPMRSGLTHVLFPISDGGIQPGEVTVAELLRASGYRTAAIGKWHLGHRDRYLPTRHGFDSFFGIPYSNDMTPTPGPGAPGAPRYPGLPMVRDTATVETEPDQTKLTARYTEEAVRVIQGSKQKPFFLYFAHTFPHVPLYAGERFRGKSLAGLYGDVIEEIDWSVGEVLRTLKETGRDRDTLVVFSSDNGPWLTRKEFGGTAGLLRDGKGTTYEGGMREPCLARWPGHIPAGVVTMAQGSMLDLLPTFAAAGGATLPAERIFDGENIMPVLTGASAGHARTFFYWNQVTLEAVRQGPWKLRTVKGKTELYNVEADPSERFDRSGEQPELVHRLTAIMQKHEATMERGAPQR